MPIATLLAEAGLETEAPPTRRIFTNRDLDFESIQVIGFDMDYTLAMYRQEALDELSVKVTVDKLIERGYPERVRQGIESDPAFAVRGLVVDKQCGNLLKVDRHGYVGRAFHGKRRLLRGERKETYRSQRIGTEKGRFAYVDTLFSLPEVTIYAELVGLIDDAPQAWANGGPPSYEQAWNDTREAIDEAHRDESIKRIIKADPGSYIKKDPDLAATLHKLRSAGKKIFLLTNSFFPYSNAVMSFLLDDELEAYDDWTVYFDWMVVGGGKPGFFTDNRPFQEVDRRTGEHVGPPVAEPQKGRIFEGGNLAGLQRSLGVYPDETLYVGDHIYGDIVKSRTTSGWRTALVVEDLEHELEVRASQDITLQEIELLIGLRNQLNQKIAAQRQMSKFLAKIEPSDLERAGVAAEDAAGLLEQARADARQRFERLREHEAEMDQTLDRRRLRAGLEFNQYWGSLFAERYDASLFGLQVENYACLYTSRVSNFLYASPAHRFHAPHGRMPHWSR